MTTVRAGGSTTPSEALLIGPYRPVRRLGEGGMGVVHLAVDAQGRAVALKVLRDHVCADPEARARLRREVETLRRVRTPHVAEVLAADLDGDRPYLATRYVPGRTLDERVRRDGPLRTPDVVRIGLVLAQALQAIHGAGVVHRDVKPANVMLLDAEPVLIDFGIAHIADESRITRAGLVMGTPGYLSPEVAAGWPLTPATDWWGWGSTLAFAASGRSPFGSGPIEVVLDRVRQGRPDLTGVDPRLVPVLLAALAADPRRRPPAGALVGMLQSASASASAPAAPPDAGRAGPTRYAPLPATRRQASQARPRGRTLPPAPAVPPTVLPAPGTHAPSSLARSQAPRPVASTQAPRPVTPTQAPRPGPAGGGEPSPSFRVREGSRATTLVLLAALAAFAGAAALAPGTTAVAFVVLSALARTIDRTMTGVFRRRVERGPRAGDGFLVVLALPWRILMAILAAAAAAVLPFLVGLATAFIVASGLAVDVSRMHPETGPALAAAAVAAGLVAWWGPGGGSLRRGSRALVRGVAPTRAAGVVLVVLLLAGAIAAVGARASGMGPDLTPFAPPDLPAWVF